MTPLRFMPLVVKQVTRHRVRTLLTVSGIAMVASRMGRESLPW